MYDHIAPGYNELHGDEQRRKLDRLLLHADLPSEGTILDVGCGTAHLAPVFENLDYLGVDPSQPLLDEAPEGVKTIHAAGEDLPIPDASADVVLSLTALHNYDDWKKGVDELARVATDLVLVGVLRKAPDHDAIVDRLCERFAVDNILLDTHDTLLVLRKT